MNDDDDKKTVDAEVDHHYNYQNLDGYSTENEDAVEATDPDHIADEILGNKRDMSADFDDSNDPDDVQNTDLGGLYNREDMYDEDGEGGDADKVGTWGIDDDTG